MQILSRKRFLLSRKKRDWRVQGIRAGIVIATEVLTICIMQAELVIIMATNEVCVCAGDGTNWP